MRTHRARAALLGAMLLPISPIATLSAQRAASPAPRAEAPIPDIPYTRFVLKNGLRLLVHEDHKAPIVAVNVWYHVGSKNEKPGKTGFAHLFEHLMFNGSEHYNDDYFKAVEPVGATDLNGTTNEDRTNYFQNVPVGGLDRILWLESDRMGHLLGVVDQPRLDEQRGVVQNEKRQGENQPYGRSWITVAENTYPRGHPYSWSVIGSMEDLDAASLADVKEWFQTYYGAANAVIVIAGDVKPEEVRQKVERYFGDIPPGPPIVKQGPWVSKGVGTRRQILQDRVPQARVIKVWNVAQFGTVDAVRLTLVSRLLTSGKSSRLYKRLVYDEKIATDVVSFLDEREIGGQIWVWATAQPGGDLAKVERALDEEIARLLRDGPTAAEVERVRTAYRAGFIRGLERIGGFGGKSDVLAQNEVYVGDPEAYKLRLRRVASATPLEIRDAARRWLDDGAYVLEVRPFPEFEAVATGVDRSKMPELGAVAAAPLPSPESIELSNGLKVQLVRRTGLPIVSMRLVADAGYAADFGGPPGVAALATEMLTDGTRNRTAIQISDEAAALGANLNAFASVDASAVTLSALKDRLAPSLALFADVALNPSYPQSDLERRKLERLATIQQEKVDPFGMALRVVPALLYGPDHAYSQPLTGSGTEASIKGMRREQLERFHRTWFKPNHSMLIVVGDVTLAELRPGLERAFGGWARGDIPAKPAPAAQKQAATELYIMDRPGAEQSVIIAGQLVPERSNPADLAFELFNDAFGGAFMSRVNMNLREGKHWSYGAGSFTVGTKAQRPWFVYAPVQTDKTKESVQEMVKEMRDALGARPLAAPEVSEAKDRMTRSLAGRWETAGSVASALQEIKTYGLPEDYYRTYAERVVALTPDEVARSAKGFVDADRVVWVVVGDRAKIEPGLRELNVGRVRILDADGRPKENATP